MPSVQAPHLCAGHAADEHDHHSAAPPAGRRRSRLGRRAAGALPPLRGQALVIAALQQPRFVACFKSKQSRVGKAMQPRQPSCQPLASISRGVVQARRRAAGVQELALTRGAAQPAVCSHYQRRALPAPSPTLPPHLHQLKLLPWELLQQRLNACPALGCNDRRETAGRCMRVRAGSDAACKLLLLSLAYCIDALQTAGSKECCQPLPSSTCRQQQQQQARGLADDPLSGARPGQTKDEVA